MMVCDYETLNSCPGLGSEYVICWSSQPALSRARCTPDPRFHSGGAGLNSLVVTLEVVRSMPKSSRIHSKAEEEAASGADGDGDNAARRRPCLADVALYFQA